jgi:hypothetical protein
MKKIKEMTIGEFGAYVCSYLDSNGIKCVLTGGGCVTIYTNNRYASYDLDFIDITDSSRKKIKGLLEKIGFKEKNRYFKHPQTKFFIEFPKGPIYLGDELITNYNEINFDTGKLILLSPTDSVKDRLAAYYHWGDNQALEQAVMVAQNHKVNLKEIKTWSEKEGHPDKFKNIKSKLRKHL